jgi:hypothetical protein
VARAETSLAGGQLGPDPTGAPGVIVQAGANDSDGIPVGVVAGLGVGI